MARIEEWDQKANMVTFLNDIITYLNDNAGAVTALATVALLLVTGWYAYTTQALLREAKHSRLQASEPRVVGYLRAHEVLPNIVQLCVSNLSGAPAVSVSATILKITEWPTKFSLHESKILRDLTFLRSMETVKLDVGIGHELFRDKKGAEFEIDIRFSSIDGRSFTFKNILRVDSVVGGNFKVYGVDDIARRLKDISDTLKSFNGLARLKVEIYDANDREVEAKMRREYYESLQDETAEIRGESEKQ